ncbi:MAG TPA: phosphate ABC transporter substrate-binding protein PstS [Burkholderiales bacterium]|nr:phosphate ABC transporter substrate-binding protein PstS [Burkholderiales bacterium]
MRLPQTLGVLAVTLSLAAASAGAADITGAGATFPYPLYAKWAQAYKAKTNNNLNYQSIGSGGGIRQIQNKTVDFGASDMPLKPEELNKNELLQFPTVIGGNVPVINVAGIKPGELKLTGPLLADIYLGKVRKWNDAAIASLNPGVKLPDTDITVVHRSDGSGTTFIWTNYLSKVSPEWKQKVSEGTSVNWPVGVGGKGNEGVASYVQRIRGAIGYVEYAYALQNKLVHALLKNRDGAFVAPSIETFKAAAAGAQWEKAPGLYLILTDQPGKASWPVSGATFILMHKVQDKPERAKEVLRFFDWAYAEGDPLATALDYVPLPDSLVKLIETTWKRDIRDARGNPVWP